MEQLLALIESDSDSDEDYVPRRPRWLRERQEYFYDLDEADFVLRFRLSKRAALDLLIQIEDQLEFISDRNLSISPINQLLATLRFYATNFTQLSIGDFGGWSASTANKIVHRVSAAIAALHTTYINFPESPEQIRKEQDNFYGIARFPRVVGAMDCTHVKLSTVPLNFQIGPEQAEMFRNRKGYHSINVQTIVNSNMEITDIVARWPGSTHDCTIFNNCYRKAQLESGKYGNALLVVDGGYAATSYLVPPLETPNNAVEQLYNESQIRTRNPVERSYGVWKRRFPVMALGMRIKLDKALVVIMATAVLHNILRRRGEPVPPDDPELVLPAPWEELLQEGQIRNEPRSRNTQHLTRDTLIASYFSRLSESQ